MIIHKICVIMVQAKGTANCYICIKLWLACHFSQHYSSQSFNSADYELFRVISLSLNHVCILKQTSYRLVHISDSVSKFV